MSSNAAFCSRCGYTADDITEEQRDLLSMRRLREKIYHLSMTSYFVISVLGGGFGWLWWSSGGFEHRPTSGPFILMGIAALAYLAVRASLFGNRRKLKILRKKNAAYRN